MERELNRIASLLMDGLVEQALVELDQVDFATLDDSQLVYALCLRGDVLMQAGMLQEALASYEEASANEPEDVHVLAGLGKAYALLSRFADAEECLEQALELEPDCAMARFNLAMTLLYERQYEDAIAEFEQLGREEDVFPDIFVQWGYALFELGMEDRQHLPAAIQAFEHAAEMDPEDARVQIYIGNCQTQLGEWDKAEASYVRAAQLAEKDTDVLVYWSIMLQAKGDLPAAESKVQQALEFEPQAPDLWSLRGEIACDAKQYQQAEEFFIRSLDYDPLWTYGLSGLARVALVQERHDEAQRFAFDALRSDTGNEEALWVLRELRRASVPNLEYAVSIYGRHSSGMSFTRNFLVLAKEEKEAVAFVSEIEALCEEDLTWTPESVEVSGEWSEDPPGVYVCGVYNFFEESSTEATGL